MEPLIVYGKPDCTDFLRSTALLDSLEVPFEWRDIVASPEHAERAAAISGGARSPVVVFADGSFQVEPSDAELAVRLGFPAPDVDAAAEACEI